jgi:hypothetical protein
MAEGINKYINTIMNRIYDNQNICKLLYYNQSNPLSQPDISDTSILYTDKNNKKLFATPFSIHPDEKQKCSLTLILNKLSLDQNTKYLRNVEIAFIICCHNKLWELNDNSGEIKLRPAEIMNELDLLFNRKSTTTLGRNHFNDANVLHFNENYSGYRVCYKGLDLALEGGTT